MRPSPWSRRSASPLRVQSREGIQSLRATTTRQAGPEGYPRGRPPDWGGREAEEKGRREAGGFVARPLGEAEIEPGRDLPVEPMERDVALLGLVEHAVDRHGVQLAREERSGDPQVGEGGGRRGE